MHEDRELNKFSWQLPRVALEKLIEKVWGYLDIFTGKETRALQKTERVYPSQLVSRSILSWAIFPLEFPYQLIFQTCVPSNPVQTYFSIHLFMVFCCIDSPRTSYHSLFFYIWNTRIYAVAFIPSFHLCANHSSSTFFFVILYPLVWIPSYANVCFIHLIFFITTKEMRISNSISNILCWVKKIQISLRQVSRVFHPWLNSPSNRLFYGGKVILRFSFFSRMNLMSLGGIKHIGISILKYSSICVYIGNRVENINYSITVDEQCRIENSNRVLFVFVLFFMSTFFTPSPSWSK